MWSPLASASIVFLILYLFLFIFLAALFALRKVPWKSRWLVLLLHVLCRLASQACGLAFGIVGYSNINVLVAYYVLGAEGYFTLVVCLSRYLIAWQRQHWRGYSWMEPVDPYAPKHGKAKMRFKQLFEWKKSKDEPKSAHALLVVDWLLIAANVIIIVGGSLSAAAYRDSDLTYTQREDKLKTSRGMRAAGQAVFLAINILLLVCIIVSMHQHRQHRFDNGGPNRQEDEPVQDRKNVPDQSLGQSERRPWYGHKTLALIYLTWPFLAVRGIFGVAQAVVPDLNYFNSEVYDANNLTQQFVTEETCMVTMMEFISATLIALTYFTTRSEHHTPRAIP
ncbi:uncharacterized protein PSANT_05311 [Moesziomyces antarcticus]|uniref:Uncharacterized protein n=1 Tax=Pseudozyma antarctica TaxID=84753 RepID=A0A5C3FTC3_PSEA2|nr:uncharacterized protein PSANT_05311 [Moesziomyces antarcticus]